MQKSISKRLLAGILSIVMVLSLFVAVPAKSEAANNVCTIELDRFAGYGLAGAVDVAGITIGNDNMATKIYNNLDGVAVVINNGSYDLDPDDKIDPLKVNTVTIMFEPLDIATWKNVQVTQVNLGDLASTNDGYEKATMSYKGNMVYVTVKTTPQDKDITAGNITSLRTNAYNKLTYGAAFPTKLTSARELHFTMGTLRWFFYDGTKETYPVKAALTDPTGTQYYGVRVVLSAKAGYTFKNIYNTPAVNPIRFEDTVAGVDWRIADVSKDGKTCTLEIKGYGLRKGSLGAVTMTRAEFVQEMNFNTNEVLTVAELLRKLPTSFTVVVGGKEQTVDFSALAAWHLYTVSGSETVEITNDRTMKLQDKVIDDTATDADFYYAVLEGKDSYFDANGVAKDAVQYVGANDVKNLIGTQGFDWMNYTTIVRNALYLAGIADSKNIMMGVEEFWATTGDPNDAHHGWTVKCSINSPDYRRNEVKALTAVKAPTIEVRSDVRYDNNNVAEYTWDYDVRSSARNDLKVGTMEAVDATTTVAAHPTGAWNMAAGARVTVNNRTPGYDKKYFVTYTEADYHYGELASPMAFEFVDPFEGLMTEAKAGAIAVDMDLPYGGTEYFDTPNAVTGSMDLAGILYPAGYCDIAWEPEEAVYTDANGDYFFDFATDFTATIAIPFDDTVKVSFTPEVRINGEKASKVEVDNENCLIKATFNFGENNSKLFIKLDNDNEGRADKLLFTDFHAPCVGCAVPTVVNPTDSSSRFYSFKKITWYENGVEYTGKTFNKGKRYTAEVTYDIKGAFSPYVSVATNWEKLLGLGYAEIYARSIDAKAYAADKTLKVVYEFPEALAGKYVKANDINITIPNGMEADAMYNYIENQLFSEVVLEGGATGLAEVDGFVWSDGSILDKTVAQMFAEFYKGINKYDPEKKSAQDFTFVAVMDASHFDNLVPQRINVNIHVSGEKGSVLFDANGGVYAGENITVENGKEYGFKYVASQIYRAGYFFAGWYTAAEGGTRVYAKNIYDGTVKTLYAHWTKTFTGLVKEYTAVSYSAGRLTVTAKKPVTLVNGYEFTYSKDGVNWTTKTKLTEKTNEASTVYYFIGLEKGTYNVRVRAFRYDSTGAKVYGAWSKVTKATVK